MRDRILFTKNKSKGGYYLLCAHNPPSWVDKPGVEFVCNCGFGLPLKTGEQYCSFCKTTWKVGVSGRSVRLTPVTPPRLRFDRRW